MTNEELLKEIEWAKTSGATKLILSGKGITDLPPELFQLTSLTELNLSDNLLTALPQEFCQLINLTWLHLGRNQFATLPLEILQLTNLRQLNLGYNELYSLPLELFKLTNLIELHLHKNQLDSLPPEICQLTHLTILEVGDNQLTSLPKEICQLKHLTRLDLSYNQLETLPIEICQLVKLKKLDFRGNPLISPPLEIAQQGIEAIHQYFVALEKGTRPLNEVKVIFVGDGAAGKTSLVKQLLGQPFDKDEDTTHGINIQDWEPQCGGIPIKVNIWDFGGQEIMHATHQFFLSKNSLYVLVLDGRKDEQPEYWLQQIESFGGDSPVLVVLNKQDSNPLFQLNRPFLQEKYKGIRQFLRTSCKTGEGIAQFKEAFIAEIGKVPIISILFPQSWFRVKESLRDLVKTYMSHEDYDSLCAKAGIAGEENRETLVEFLHDLGAFVHFKGYILNAIYVLNPIWVTNAVYTLINAEQTVNSKGRLRLDSLGKILPQGQAEPYRYPDHIHSYIIELMKKFQLCWRIGEEAVLIPQLLPVAEPKFSFDYSGALGFVLHYHSFLPPSLMPRFLVKRHEQIKGDLCWRTGAVLEDKVSGTEAVVKADMEARRIYIWVNGSHRKEYLTFLWFSLREINDSFEKLAVSERIPMPDNPHITADYQTLLNCMKEGMERYMPDGAAKSYSVKELLGLVEPSKEDEQLELLRMIKAQIDEKESTADMVNSILEVKPGFFGISLNLNELYARLFGSRKQR